MPGTPGHGLTLSQPGGGGGGFSFSVPGGTLWPLPQVHFLKYLKNALSYELETF